MSIFDEISAPVNASEIFDTHEHVANFDWGYAPDDAPIGPSHARMFSRG